MASTGRSMRLLLVLGIVLTAALFGILTRPPGLLATFWFANAILLAMMIRWPVLIEWPTWIAAGLGYVGADVLTGNSLSMALQLNGANLVGVTVGALLVYYLRRVPFRLVDSSSLLWMVIVALASAATTAAAAAALDRLVRAEPFWETFLHWGSTEIMSYLMVLPLILTVTVPAGLGELRRKIRPATIGTVLVPLIATAACVPIALSIQGPIALILPLPALLWCATRVSVPSTAFVSVVWTVGTLMMAGSGRLYISDQTGAGWSESVVTSIAVTLIALGPIAVACATSERRAAERELFLSVEYDHLTGAHSRGAFLRRAEKELIRVHRRQAGAALLMLDLDHFKNINDTHGHMAGDSVLTEFATRTAKCLSGNDLIGRLGGEEFAVLLPGCSFTRSMEVAECIRSAQLDYTTESGVLTTVSIGVAWAERSTPSLTALMGVADEALYDAKRAGRNAVKARNLSEVASAHHNSQLEPARRIVRAPSPLRVVKRGSSREDVVDGMNGR